MRNFITVNVLPQSTPMTIAVGVIATFSSQEVRGEASTTLVLTLNGKTVYSIAESYEQLVRLIEDATT